MSVLSLCLSSITEFPLYPPSGLSEMMDYLILLLISISVFEVAVVAIMSVLRPNLLAHPSSFNPQVCAVHCDKKSLEVCSVKSI